MERKKMRKIQRLTQSSHDDDNDRSQSRDHIPLDLIFEILSRLPAKSMVRSRSVSKLWSSITTTPDFIKSFTSRSSASSRHFVQLIYNKRDKLFVFSYPLHQDTYAQVESYQFTIPDNGYLRRYDSVHGLIYLETLRHQLMILNPTMKRFFTLPRPEGYVKGYLGYDPVDNKYKAMCILKGDKIGILTLGAQESWRIISQGFPHSIDMGDFMLCINGVMYCDGYFFGLLMKPAIMSFDLRSEKFNLINYPMDNFDGRFDFLFVSYEGKLALAIGSDGRSGVQLWILEDAENQRWVYKLFPPTLPYTRWKLMDMKFKGVTDAGEFIYLYAPNSTSRRGRMDLVSTEKSLNIWFHIVYHDPKKKCSREVKILRGSAYDDFKGLGVVGHYFMRGLSVTPNHIESLMPL